MKLGFKIKERIVSDDEFSAKLSLILNIKQQSVIAGATRNSKSLLLYPAVMFYKEQGYTDEDIFDKK